MKALENTDLLSGTSYFGHTITASRKRLIEIFGLDPTDGDGGYKTFFEWDIDFFGLPISVYDWKLGRIPCADEIIDWHIGGRNETETRDFQIYVLGLLTK